MPNLIVAQPAFEQHWPYVAERFYNQWRVQDEALLVRLEENDLRPLNDLCPQPETITRLVCLGLSTTVTAQALQAFSGLQEATFPAAYGPSQLSAEATALLQEQGVTLYDHYDEGFWGQSVSEFALALTLCGLRRIPQAHHSIISSHQEWDRYSSPENLGPGKLGHQFSDEAHFTNGTIAGKRVRIVGAGNIGSRYASFVNMLGANVAAWDPYATAAHFHRAGSRREWHLDQLVKDAEIFVPMLPLTQNTQGLVTANHIRALPSGCLVILATRAKICDVDVLRERVLANELSLAADVFDIEPLPLDDPLLGRYNVVHTPHLAGRTKDANWQWADMLMAQFQPTQ